MNKKDILQRLSEINLDKNEYWLVTGGAMVMYGIKEETNDIDLGCSTKLADELETQGHKVIELGDGTRKLTINDDIELFENWLFGTINIIEGIPVISLNGLLEMKKSLGREKDYRDTELIEKYLNGSYNRLLP